jgi:hypothetical protein
MLQSLKTDSKIHQTAFVAQLRIYVLQQDCDYKYSCRRFVSLFISVQSFQTVTSFMCAWVCIIEKHVARARSRTTMYNGHSALNRTDIIKKLNAPLP